MLVIYQLCAVCGRETSHNRNVIYTRLIQLSSWISPLFWVPNMIFIATLELTWLQKPKSFSWSGFFHYIHDPVVKSSAKHYVWWQWWWHRQKKNISHTYNNEGWRDGWWDEEPSQQAYYCPMKIWALLFFDMCWTKKSSRRSWERSTWFWASKKHWIIYSNILGQKYFRV